MTVVRALTLCILAIATIDSCGDSTPPAMPLAKGIGPAWKGTSIDGRPIPATVRILDSGDTVDAELGSVELTFGIGESILTTIMWSMSLGGPHPSAAYWYTSSSPHFLAKDTVAIYLTGAEPTLVGYFDDTLLVLGPPNGVPTPNALATDIGKHVWRLHAVPPPASSFSGW